MRSAEKITSSFGLALPVDSLKIYHHPERSDDLKSYLFLDICMFMGSFLKGIILQQVFYSFPEF